MTKIINDEINEIINHYNEFDFYFDELKIYNYHDKEIIRLLTRYLLAHHWELNQLDHAEYKQYLRIKK